MRAAGCELFGETARDGTMALGSLAKIASVRRTVQSIRAWAADNHVDVHVPVDSPAANWHIAWWMKEKRGARVVNLVAPQLWAWAPWRLGKWRRVSSCMMCLLPFEEAWFTQRGMRAVFVGHPVLSQPVGQDVLARAAAFPQGARRLLLLPGSRSNEVRDNMHHMLRIYAQLAATRPDLTGLVMAANDGLLPLIKDAQRKAGMAAWPANLHLSSGDAEAAIAWCQCALNVSGTVSLDLAHQHRPMVAVYWTGWFSALVARFILNTPHRLLPNIVAGKRVVPEFVPYAGSEARVAEALAPLLDDAGARERMAAELAPVAARFAGHDPGREAAAIVLEVMKQGADAFSRSARIS